MTNNDRKKFSELIGVVWFAFGNGKKLNPNLMEIYFKSLEKYSIEQVENAFTRSMQLHKWFPKPVEIIELITGSNEENGDYQATEVLDAIKQYGAYSSVSFQDKTTQAVIKRVYGGWVKMCSELKENDIKWFLKDFAKYYKSFKSKGVEYGGHLGGLIESSNEGLGIKHDDVKQIGQVLEQIGYEGTK